MANTIQSDLTKTTPTLNKSGVYEVLQDPDAKASVLFTICIVIFGGNEETKDFVNVDPLLLDKWLKEEFGTHLHEFNENKLQAVFATLQNDYFYNDLQTFKSVCKTLTCGDPGAYNEDLFDSNPTLPEMLWGIYEMSLIADDRVVEDSTFSYTIKNFINIIVNHTGQELIPDDLDGDIDVIQEGIKDIKEQYIKIGMETIPPFPSVDLDI